MGIFNSQKTEKKQIVLHHTAGTGTIQGVINWWLRDKWAAVGTPWIIDREGKSREVYNSNLWSSHIGIRALDRLSVGIELINWGFIVNGKTYVNSNYLGEVENVRFKGYNFWEPYTTSQLNAMLDVIEKECVKHKIDKQKGLPFILKGVKRWNTLSTREKQQFINDSGVWAENLTVDGILGAKSKEAFNVIERAVAGDYSRIFDINFKAMKGEEGIWTHVNYRKDKFDMYPSKQLIKVLEEI